MVCIRPATIDDLLQMQRCNLLWSVPFAVLRSEWNCCCRRCARSYRVCASVCDLLLRLT